MLANFHIRKAEWKNQWWWQNLIFALPPPTTKCWMSVCNCFKDKKIRVLEWVSIYLRLESCLVKPLIKSSIGKSMFWEFCYFRQHTILVLEFQPRYLLLIHDLCRRLTSIVSRWAFLAPSSYCSGPKFVLGTQDK